MRFFFAENWYHVSGHHVLNKYYEASLTRNPRKRGGDREGGAGDKKKCFFVLPAVKKKVLNCHLILLSDKGWGLVLG